MRQVIYVDILFCVNLFVNYAILLSTAKILKKEVSRLRLCIGGIVGAICSFVIFLPQTNLFITCAIRFLISFASVFPAFGKTSLKQMLKILMTFYLLSFAFAGIMLTFINLTHSSGVAVHNSIVYIDISPLTVIVMTLLCYSVLTIIERFTSHRLPEQILCEVTLEVDGKHVRLKGITDTGNTLRETFSDFPVVVVQYESVEEIIPGHLRNSFQRIGVKDLGDWGKRYRVIPFSTVSGEGLLPSFRPDLITVKTTNGTIKKKNVYIAVSQKEISDGEYKAILNAEIVME